MILSQLGDMVCFQLGSQATNATARAYFDTQNFNASDILIMAAKATATNASATFTSVALQHSDVTNASSFSTIINGTTGTPTSSQFALNANNDTSAFTTCRLSLKGDGRKRYVGVVWQPATTYNTTAMAAVKSRASEGPSALGGAVSWGIA